MFTFINGGVFVRRLNKSQEAAFGGPLNPPHGGGTVRGGGELDVG